MTTTDIPHLRLQNQQVTGITFTTVRDLVAQLTAMQAQDYNMCKWAVGLRLPGTTDAEVEAALARGDVIRTHLLRPTWHLVAAEDLHWLLDLTGPRIKASLKTRWKALELDDNVVNHCYRLFETALAGGAHRTRDELRAVLDTAGIPSKDNNRFSHILMSAELDKLICSGAPRGKKQTYALLADRVPPVPPLPREEALAKLAVRYFTSHGPATLPDFIWWSGLPARDARLALELAKDGLVSETVDNATYWLSPAASGVDAQAESVHLLPAFDEFLISYRDRSAALARDNHAQVISINGIFWPIIVHNGQVKGLWKRTVNRDKVVIEPNFWHAPPVELIGALEEKAAAFGRFLEREAEVVV